MHSEIASDNWVLARVQLAESHFNQLRLYIYIYIFTYIIYVSYTIVIIKSNPLTISYVCPSPSLAMSCRGIFVAMQREGNTNILWCQPRVDYLQSACAANLTTDAVCSGKSIVWQTFWEYEHEYEFPIAGVRINFRYLKVVLCQLNRAGQ